MPRNRGNKKQFHETFNFPGQLSPVSYNILNLVTSQVFLFKFFNLLLLPTCQEGKRVVPLGPKLSIPETYEGYFEILSEDGRSVRCIGRGHNHTQPSSKYNPCIGRGHNLTTKFYKQPLHIGRGHNLTTKF